MAPVSLGGTASASAGSTHSHTMSGAAPSSCRMYAAGFWFASPAQTVSSVSGTTGLTWIKLGAFASTTWGMEIWSADAPSGHSAVSVTMNFTRSLPGCDVHVWYETGKATGSTLANIVDGSPVTAFSSAAITAWSAGPLTTTVANVTLYGFAGNDSNSSRSSAPDSGWAEVMPDVLNSGHAWGSVIQYQTVTATGSYTTSGTWDGGADFASLAMILAVQDVGGGGGGAPFPAVQIVRSNIRIGP